MIHFVLMRCLLLASTMGPSLDGRSTLGPLFVWLSFLTLLRGLLTLCKARFHHVRYFGWTRVHTTTLTSSRFTSCSLAQ